MSLSEASTSEEKTAHESLQPARRYRGRCIGLAISALVLCVILVASVCAFVGSSAGKTPPPGKSDNSTATGRTRQHSPHILNRDTNDFGPYAAIPEGLPDPRPAPDSFVWNRGEGGPYYYGPYTYFCGVFHTANYASLNIFRGLRQPNETISLRPHDCYRAHCRDTSAVYVCNDNDHEIKVNGDQIGYLAIYMNGLCCRTKIKSGQIFHPDKWNVVVAYGNCRHSDQEGPATFGTTNGGVNGVCLPPK